MRKKKSKRPFRSKLLKWLIWLAETVLTTLIGMAVEAIVRMLF